MIEAIIVDDEPNAIKNLKWEIERFCDGIVIRDTFTNPVEAISAINYLKPNCVFLDIEMPQMDGFQLLKNLHFRNFDLIITTAYDSYAIKAFKANAVDYLLKPIDSDDLIQAIEKIKKRKLANVLGFDLNEVLSTISLPDKRVALPMAGKCIMVDHNDIIYCKSEGNYSEVFLEEGQSHLISRQLKDLESDLSVLQFIRVHNSFIVNMRKVKEYVKTDGGYLVMSNSKTVPISRTQRKRVQNLLNV